MTKHTENEYVPVRCEDIRESLFEYLTQELGEGSSDLVRIHLRRCDACRRQAAELKKTLDLLRDASRDATGIPTKLSDEHYARLLRAVLHPVLDWIYRHHIMVSVVVAAVMLAVIGFLVRKVDIRRRDELGPSYPVIIDETKAPTAVTPSAER